MRHAAIALTAALLLPGCAASLKYPRGLESQEPVPAATPIPRELGSEVRAAGQVLIQAQDVINGVSRVIAPSAPSVAKPAIAPVEEPPVQEVEPPFLSREFHPPIDAEETKTFCYVNPGGEAFHVRASCPYVRGDAQRVPCVDAARYRRPCKTCGGDR